MPDEKFLEKLLGMLPEEYQDIYAPMLFFEVAEVMAKVIAKEKK